MKKRGSKVEYAEARISELMRLYREYTSSCRHISLPDVYSHIVDMPSKRFWVSGIRAAVVVSAMIRGEDVLSKMRQSKREMFQEIYARVVKIKETNPSISILDICERVVEQPAPKIYLSAGSAKIMICQYRREKRNHERNRRDNH